MKIIVSEQNENTNKELGNQDKWNKHGMLTQAYDLSAQEVEAGNFLYIALG